MLDKIREKRKQIGKQLSELNRLENVLIEIQKDKPIDRYTGKEMNEGRRKEILDEIQRRVDQL